MTMKIISICLLVTMLFACLAVVKGNTQPFAFENWLRNLSNLSKMPKPPAITFTTYNFAISTDFPIVNIGSWYNSDSSDWQNTINFFKYGMGNFFVSIGQWFAYLPTFLNSSFQNFKVIGYALRDIAYMIKYPFDIIGWFFSQMSIVTQGVI